MNKSRRVDGLESVEETIPEEEVVLGVGLKVPDSNLASRSHSHDR